MKIHKSFIGLCLVTLLTGCGGGGGGGAAAPSGPVTSTLSFPAQSAYSTLIATGFTKNFTVSGTCNGSATVTAAAAAGGATFEGVSALLSAVSTFTTSLSNCTPASSAVTTTNYYDTNYVPLGFNSAGTSYGVFVTPPSIPLSVAVGSTGTLGTENIYTNSTKSVLSGTRVFSYVVEADTASTAIVNFISQSYNTSNALTVTQQSRYRIASTGPLTLISIDVQFAVTSTTHLIYQ